MGAIAAAESPGEMRKELAILSCMDWLHATLACVTDGGAGGSVIVGLSPAFS